MLSDTAKGLRWSISIGIKFLRVVPVMTLVIVLFTLTSQIAMLLASFLPLKVIIMLGSEGVPSYFPDFLAYLERDILIGLLSAGTVGFFLIHLAAERVIEAATHSATATLLSQSHKMVLFENQENIAVSSYQRYSRAFAGGVFIALASFVLLWFYPRMLLIVLGYFTFILLLLWQGTRYSRRVRERLEMSLGPFMSTVGTVGFFVGFAFLVLDFVFLTPPGVIVALISFLLIRQTMQRASSLISDLSALYKRRDRLNALFFHGHVFQPLQIESDSSPWVLLKTESRRRWILQVLRELTGHEYLSYESKWEQLGARDVVGIRVQTDREQFLFKLYGDNRSSLARHEISLMMDRPTALPALRWIGNITIGRVECLVYNVKRGERPEVHQSKSLSHQLHANLLAVELSAEATGRYMRSKAMLWQRVGRPVIERLMLVAQTETELQALTSLAASLKEMQCLLMRLPLAVSNPEISEDAIWLEVDPVGDVIEPVLLNWGRWALEPVGAGWPVRGKRLHRLGGALAMEAVKRPELAQVDIRHAELAALVFALEREYTRQRYTQAIELIPAILERF